MIAGCCKNLSLKLAVCLLVLRLQGRWTLAAECGVGTFEVSTRDGTICCKTCIRSRDNEPCPNADSLREECRCAQGYVCKGDPCDSCTKPTSCPEGQELIRTGSVDYLYICRKCSPGMHTVNGFCKPIIKPVTSATKMYTSIASTSSSSSLRYSNGVHQLNEKGASSSSIDGKRIENTEQAQKPT
ncbi:tumor necrosis factor receptor superfamily member 18 [Bombina bombina]|uniref:tumor necrosis factor receptor superfamily member 18 n=1 Tax=Bombina bombina TaxID=8345 RepID=UPI00235AE227|nr:tumor necrosis factor receptor superfamily member 18 [Bombina bombina]